MDNSAESHWTETVHLFKDRYPNLTDIENHLEKNETEVGVETENISPTKRENSEASKQNFADAPITKNRFKSEWNRISNKHL